MRIALVAGEPSGDLLGASLLAALKTRYPDVQTYGVGGAHMQAQGFDVRWPYDPLAVNGYADVIKNLPSIWRLRQTFYQNLLADPPDAFIGIDAPDFNLGLERKLKARGIPTLHFISPSIWAWRGGRIHNIAKSVDHMLCVFPFEKVIYDKAKVAASFVGHPLATQIPLQPDTKAAQRTLQLDTTKPVLALLPGSRRSEIERMVPRFFAALHILLQTMPDLQVVLPAIPKFYPVLSQNLKECQLHTRVKLLHGQSHTALAACDVTLVTSGTATLEAMLFKKPMVISYVTSPLSAMMVRRLSYIPWAGLPNILANKALVPELLQERAAPQAMVQAVLQWFSNPQASQDLVQEFTRLHKTLLVDTVTAVCNAIQSVVSNKHS